MKKILHLFIFLGFFIGFSTLGKAQMKEPTSLEQKSDDGVFTAYPNPAKDFLIVKAKDPSLRIRVVSFYTILGVQISNVVVNANSGEINTEKLKPGKYLLRYILSDNTQKVIQIVKQ
jgi:hypothetical protein